MLYSNLFSRPILRNVYKQFLKIYILKTLFISDRGERREKERRRNITVWLPLVHALLGTWPATQACALTGNQTDDLLVCSLVLNPLNHTSQGYVSTFKNLSIILTLQFGPVCKSMEHCISCD